jgi:hypothetical protein
MKSQQQDEKQTLTSCKDCVLAIYDGKTQTSCLANRIEKFEYQEAYDEEKEFFVIKRFCNYYRNNKEVYTKDGSIDIDRIRKESKITLDIAILCNHMDYEYYKYILDLYYYVLNNYNQQKVSFHLLYTIANKEQIELIKKLQSEIQNSSTTFYTDDLYLHNIISKTNKSYHVIIQKEKRPGIDFASKLNNVINEDMKKIITFVDNDVYVFSNLAYKIISHQKQSYIYQDIIQDITNQTKQTDLHYE